MNEGFRRTAARAGIVILICLLGTGCYYLYKAGDQREASYHYQPAAHPHVAFVGKAHTEADPYEPSCYNPNSNSDADLCSQWAAADQAAETNRLASLGLKFSLFSLIFTFVGTLLLVWTLMETRWMARTELRAYVSAVVIGTHFHRDGRGLITIGVKNTNGGQTPAYNFAFAGNAVIFTRDEADKFFPSAAKAPLVGEKCPSVLHGGEGQEGELVSHRVYSDEEILGIGKERALYVFGHAVYLDIFGQRHETKFCWKSSADTDVKKSSIIYEIAPYHNSAD